jgi:anhydro-N-acetylmuramic acid kinase
MDAPLYIGLISGTSMDGIDAVLMRLSDEGQEILASHDHPWPEELRQELRAIAKPGDNEIERMGVLDIQVANQFAKAAWELLKQARIQPNQVAAIGSHGQTIRHHPGGPAPFTLQIGDPNRIAEATGITVVADFRRRDMAAGGEGAPLAPAYHAALLRKEGESRVVLNLGGIANITTLPADPDAAAVGFDTGPSNTLLDAWSREHLNRPYDALGAWAKSGQVNEALLAAMLDDPYFYKPAPKSTGPEHFHLGWLRQLLAQHPVAQLEDVQATLTALSVESIARAIEANAPDCQRLIACGGGVHNSNLMQKLEQRLPAMTIDSSAVHGIDPDHVEAAAFAWLAKQTLEGRPGNLPTVTGASHPVVLGGIYPANSFHKP